MKQNYINHVVLVIDKSSSMYNLANTVVEVADNQIAHLARRSKELDQETRVTVYTFADEVECLVYDKDVLRMPSLKGEFRPNGNTALIAATMKAIEDLKKTPELYGDHAFLVYVLTDGEENWSHRKGFSVTTLSKTIEGLPENWTVAAFVPNQTGKFEAKKFGFPNDNIAIWDTTNKGVTEVGEAIRTTTENFMKSRAVGVRGTKNLFKMDDAVANVTKQQAAAVATKLHFGQYRLLEVQEPGPVAAFVEEKTRRAYRLGEAFYQLSKPEKIGGSKQVVLMDKKTKEVYAGVGTRQLLGLPDYEVKVAPAAHPNFEIFVQSTSTNRKLVPNTKLLLIS